METHGQNPDYVEPKVDNTTVTDRAEVVTNLDRPPLISWGSLWAGLACTIAISGLLYLLGLAMGVSVADATDGDAMGQGLSISVIVWMVASCLLPTSLDHSCQPVCVARSIRPWACCTD